MLSKIDQIYVIIDKNLEPDRFEYIDNWVKTNNITNYKYHMYCYKNTLSEDEINYYYKHDSIEYWKRYSVNYYDENIKNINTSKKLTKSEISLAINHIKILEDIVKNNYKNALILESDAIFTDDFINKWNKLYSQQIPADFDVVVLGEGCEYHATILDTFKTKKEDNKYIYYNPRFSVRCTEATLFSFDACKKILKNIIPFYAPIDHEYDYHLYKNNLKSYICEPPLIFNGTHKKRYEKTIVAEKKNDPTRFYSQIGQDKYYIENIINYKKNGVFLDIGSFDGITFSNTYYLENMLDWKGICVEPNPVMSKKCLENRKCIVSNKAIFEKSNEKVEFIIPSGNGSVEGGIEQLCSIKGCVREKSLQQDFSSQYSKYSTILVDTININELLETHDIHHIDYMSLDVEGYELNILKMIDYNKNKIKFMTVEHGNDVKYQNDIKEFMESKNYQRHRINKWDDEYILVDNRKSVNSFDIFDTLLARKVKIPTDIFKIIEQKYNIPNFYENRIKAEQLSNGLFDDIYKKYKDITQIDDNDLITLKNIEIHAELDNIIPIQSNINKIKDGDIIVSDMYLPLNILIKFLKKIGINKNVMIYVTPNGKSSGNIWKGLTKDYNIISHIGDNLHSDIKMAKEFGIKAIHTQIHKYTDLEKTLIDNSFSELANIIREFRLLNPYDEYSDEFILYDEQCRINILLLCLFSIQINNIATLENKSRILFSTRDCCLLEKIFKYFYPEYNSITYFTSRHINENYNEEYKNYVKKIYNNESIIIDFNGSFKSGRKLFLEIFNILPRVHLLCYNNTCELYNELTYSCFNNMSDYIEVLNPGKGGSFYNYYNNIIYFKSEDNNRVYVNTIHDTIDSFINFIEKKQLKNLLLLFLNKLSLNKNLINEIFSDRFFTYRYNNNLITNKI